MTVSFLLKIDVSFLQIKILLFSVKLIYTINTAVKSFVSIFRFYHRLPLKIGLKKYKLEEKFLTSVVMFKRKITGDQATLP